MVVMAERHHPDWTGWEGPCEMCGTDHGGFDPDTLDGGTRCRVAQAEATADVFIIDQARALEADFHHRRDAMLRDDGHDPDHARELGLLPPKRWELPDGFLDRAPHRRPSP